MNTEHTPGPWKWEGSTARPDKYVYLQNGVHSLVGASLDGFTDNPYNARLIAAAPELLEALEKIVKFDTPLPCGLLGQAQEAIKKAKGI